jgi:hypothetical protein
MPEIQLGNEARMTAKAALDGTAFAGGRPRLEVV